MNNPNWQPSGPVLVYPRRILECATVGMHADTDQVKGDSRHYAIEDTQGADTMQAVRQGEEEHNMPDAVCSTSESENSDECQQSIGLRCSASPWQPDLKNCIWTVQKCRLDSTVKDGEAVSIVLNRIPPNAVSL